MKKSVVILFCLLSLFCDASAQWYLFQGNRKAEEIIPDGEIVTDTVVVASDSLSIAPDTAEVYVLDIPEEINISLILPLTKAEQEPNPLMYDFYSGAMLAARDLGAKGKKLCINVIDSENCEEEKMQQAITDGDIVIYAANDIEKAAGFCGKGKCIIAPLNIVEGQDSIPAIQITTPYSRFMKELSSWVTYESNLTDKVVILDEKWPEYRSDSLCCLMNSLDSLHQAYTIMTEPCDSCIKELGTTRFVCVSNDNKYLSKVLKTISKWGNAGKKVAFYSTSRTRNLRGLEDSEIFYSANTHIIAQYEIDRNDTDTRNFIDEFRQFTQAEPNRFAFHGYDITNYFVAIVSKYGRYWKMKLGESTQSYGIQSKFKFNNDFCNAMTNTACSKIIYNPDLTVSIIR